MNRAQIVGITGYRRRNYTPGAALCLLLALCLLVAWRWMS